MATANIVSGYGEWTSPGIHKTTWPSLTINTTGDVGSVKTSNGQMSLLSIYVTGTMTSVSVLQFQETVGSSTETFSVGQTVCGTNLQFDSTTGSGLSTGQVYMVRPGASRFRPKITAGASGAEDLTVIFTQAQG